MQIFSKEKHSVHLCEIVIQYTSCYEDINLAANILMTPKSKEPLYLAHRGSLESVCLASLDEWLHDGKEIPYSYIFSNLVEDRARVKPDGEVKLRKMSLEEPYFLDEISRARLLTDSGKIKDMFSHDNQEFRKERPFTLIRVGDFADNSPCLFRIEAKMNMDNAEKRNFVEEDRSTGTRIFKCYSDVDRWISGIDIPRAKSLGSEYEQEILAYELMSENRERLLSPEILSLVCLGNKNTETESVHSIGLNGKLIDFSEKISCDLYKHNFFTDDSREKINYFISPGNEESHIQFIGPMSIHEMLLRR